ncbi:MAG: pyruvate, phosphate dikinase [Patescibacteria group bacterium]
MKKVYDFTEGNASMKALLGGKGANLAEMSGLKIPVPPGFTITTEVCAGYAKSKKLPASLMKNIEAHLKKLEIKMGKKLGDSADPLLVSVRSGAAVSMPGMMDTVLNLGMNDRSVEGLAEVSGNERFAWDAYRRFIQMFGEVVLDVSHEKFEAELEKMKHSKKVKNDVDLDAADLKKLVGIFKKVVRATIKKDFPQNPNEQLKLSIEAVFRSWNNPRAVYYREMNKITGLKGTAVNVQAMVFGNLGNDSGTGVAFTRDPATGERKFFGEYLMNAQGEDVVAGIRTPQPISKLKKQNPKIYAELEKIYKKLEKHYRDMQDIEFTIERGKLFLLQTRTGKRTARAAVRIAVELVREKMISEKEAVLRVDPYSLDQLLHPTLDPTAKKIIIAKGLPASPGAACGAVVFTANEAEKLGNAGKKVILVRKETSPEDIHGMNAARGILTARGGMTSHAAVVARGMGKCCIAGAEMIEIDLKKKKFVTNGKTIREGEIITLDGGTGEVIIGKIKTVEPKLDKDFAQLMKLADKFRKLRVRTNADTPHDAEFARSFGAEGIGLCRTEHMFFQPQRILAMREMIVAETVEERKKALAKLLPYQRDDFYKIFRAMRGLPVTIRLLDPPLHEFLPQEDREIKLLAKDLKVPEKKLRERIAFLHEINPMMGMRGARLMVNYPEIVEMQSRAIFEAAVRLKKEKIEVIPEIMIPLIGMMEEFFILAKIVRKMGNAIIEKSKVRLKYAVGTMIEIPRACVRARKIARKAEFFSFGTNDLTQLTFGFSRDDAPKFIPKYIEEGILDADPFASLDQRGVGELVKMGIQRGRTDHKKLKCGICGEHGGDPASVEFCHRVGMDYVSCSPFRVPIARLAAAQAVLKEVNPLDI